MGIPGYFSHIIKNYPNIIRNLQYFTKKDCIIQHLFMDCNSLVYDAYNNLSKADLFTTQTEEEIEKDLIDEVIVAIKLLIQKISPTDTIMIAFDGVAPFAKMEQQRTRRYRTDFITKTTSSQKIAYDPTPSSNLSDIYIVKNTYSFIEIPILFTQAATNHQTFIYEIGPVYSYYLNEKSSKIGLMAKAGIHNHISNRFTYSFLFSSNGTRLGDNYYRLVNGFELNLIYRLSKR